MKIILVSNTAAYLHNMWLPLARALRARGAEVVLAAPEDADAEVLRREGFRFVRLSLERSVGTPASEARSVAELVRLYRAERPAAVHHFTIKPVLYGSLAAHLAGVPVRIASFAGLGFLFARQAAWARVAQHVVLSLYRRLLWSENSWAIFQNPDDRDTFVVRRILPERRAVVIRSSGVSTASFAAPDFPEGEPVVLCAARLLWEKGIAEYVEAARKLRNEGIAARFMLAGWRDDSHPSCIPQDVLEGWHRENVIQYVGFQTGMVELLRSCSLVVLPSKYREGVPRILVEAASMERPLVATDVPGCREICLDGVTGRLVQPGDADGLADAMRELLTDPVKARRMGAAGRRLAVDEFDVGRVVDRTLNVYEQAGVLSA